MASITVATLNIWNRLGPWEARLEVIREQLSRLSPDVIGLQEVIFMQGEHEVNQAEDIARGFGYELVVGRGVDASAWGLCNAVLSRFPIRRSVTFSLPGTEESRSVVFAEIDTPNGKQPFFSTHLNWKLDDGHVRQLQVRALVSFVRKMCGPPTVASLPPIIVGDFNAEPQSDEIRFMGGLSALGGTCVYFADCFAVAGDGSKGTTFARRNPYAMQLREPDRRIDYIFVAGPDETLRGEPLSARVCFDEPSEGVWPSDHFGVIATISA